MAGKSVLGMKGLELMLGLGDDVKSEDVTFCLGSRATSRKRRGFGKESAAVLTLIITCLEFRLFKDNELGAKSRPNHHKSHTQNIHTPDV